MSGVQGAGIGGTPVDPGSPGGINIDPLTEVDGSAAALDDVMKGKQVKTEKDIAHVCLEMADFLLSLKPTTVRKEEE